MGFLKKSNAPSELPDLAIESLGVGLPRLPVQSLPTQNYVPPQPVQRAVQQPVNPQTIPAVQKTPIAGEDYLEFPGDSIPVVPEQKNIVRDISKDEEASKLPKSVFFDQVLDDINGELKDLGNIEDWYESKFLKQDVVSNMKGYWEGNKADIIIESYGAEYKRQINEKVRILKNLEEDWREIYFKLVKKEEEMKKEERELKEVLSEFVNLCKRRKDYGEKKEERKEE
jgi:hypothetical protein